MSSQVSGLEPRQVILAGGGGAADSRLLDEVFAEWIGSGRLLYLPLALQEERHTAAAAWLRSTFQPLGVRHIESWSAFDGHDARELMLGAPRVATDAVPARTGDRADCDGPFGISSGARKEHAENHTGGPSLRGVSAGQEPRSKPHHSGGRS